MLNTPNLTASVVLFLVATVFATPVSAQSNEVVSSEAAKLLNEVIDLNEDFDETEAATKAQVNERLLRLLVRNGQYDEAESIVGAANEWTQKDILAQIAKHKIENLASDPARKDEQIESIKRLATESGGRIWSFGHNVDQLLASGRLDLATEIIESMPGDLATYKPKAGYYGSGDSKLRGFSRIAEYHLKNGDRKAADEIIKKFGEPSARDQIKMQVMSSCLRPGRLNEKVAESMLKQIEDGGNRYWAAYKLGMHFAKKRNLDKAADNARIMDQHFDKSHPQLRRYQPNLLLSIAQLSIEAGKKSDRWLERAREMKVNDQSIQADLASMDALYGDIENAIKNPRAALNAIPRLLKARHKDFGGHDSVLKLVDDELRIEAAKELAVSIDNPLLKTRAICSLVYNLPTLDIDERKKLVDLAFESASIETEPFLLNANVSIDQAEVLQEVAREYARLGEIEKAMQVVELVPDEADDRARSFGGNYTKRERALQRAMGYFDGAEDTFSAGNSEQVFAVIDRLKNFEHEKARHALNSLLRKFVDQENWDDAEKAYVLARDEWADPIGVPYQVVSKIGETNDHQRLRQWFKLCGEENEKMFLARFCMYFNTYKKLPSSRTIIEVERLLDEAWDEAPLSPNILRFLIVGLWADGFDDRARELVDELSKNKYADSYMSRLVSQARASDQPKLAFYVASKNAGARSASFLLNYYPKSSDRFNRLVDDDKWMRQQPAIVQIATKLGRAYQLLHEEKERK